MAGTCQVPKFAEPGEACDATTQCRVGGCRGNFDLDAGGAPSPLSFKGTCPTVIPDGGPCVDAAAAGMAGAPNAVCDTLSSCVNGKCAPFAYPTCDAAAAATAPLTCPDPLVVACPSAAPTAGDACPNPTPATGQSVQLPVDCAYDSGKTHCACIPSFAGPDTWACETCPATQPTPGDACTTGMLGPVSPLCVYADATCGCNVSFAAPPTWGCGSCPSSAPKTGDACDLPQGMECDFGASKCLCGVKGAIPGGTGPTWSCQ
jgi:hypothetical protein